MRSFIAIIAVFWCALPGIAQQATDPAALPSVTIEQAEMAQVQELIPVSGTLIARNEVQVFPQVSGFEVTELLVEAGDAVESGQLLARLSDASLRAQVQQAQAELMRTRAGIRQAQSQIASAGAALTQALAALDRAQRLRDSGSGSQAVLDLAIAAEANARAQAALTSDGEAVAEAAVAQAEAALTIAELTLEHTQIKAPVTGLIVERNIKRGAIAAAGGEPMFTLIEDGAIEMSAEVIETALQSLSPGLPAQVTVAGVGAIDGTVRLLPASVNPVTRLGMVRITLPADPRLRTGLFASGAIVASDRQALTVPATAVLADNAGETVRVVRDGLVEVRVVATGLLWQNRREIINGLSVGDTVIARSGAFFSNGDRVQTVLPVAPLGIASAVASDPAEMPAMVSP